MSETTNTTQTSSAKKVNFEEVKQAMMDQLLTVGVKGMKMPFTYRKIDEIIVKSILVSGEYNLPLKGFNPKLILDCGGNVGAAAIFFASKYKNAQIYSIEPQNDNFKLLQYNTIYYDNIHAMKAALWDKETFVRVEDRGFGVAGYMTFETTEDDPDAFRTVTVSSLLRDSGFDEVDLLKIDIEGAEKEVFSAPDVHDWLPKVKILTIELHDRMKRGCSYALFNALSKYHYFFSLNGENLIFIREDAIQ